MKILLASILVLGLAACGDEAKPGAAASGTAKADTKTPAATSTAASSAAPKKEDSGW